MKYKIKQLVEKIKLYKKTTSLILLSGVLSVTGISILQKNKQVLEEEQVKYESYAIDPDRGLNFNSKIEEVPQKIAEEKELKEETQPLEEENFFDQIDLSNYYGYSIKDALEKNGYESSFAFRTKIANHFEIANYKGTISQNLKLLQILKANLPKRVSEAKIEKTQEEPKEESKENISSLKEQIENEKAKEGQTHIHKYGKWQKLNDTLEQSVCSCGKRKTRLHTFKETKIKYQSTQDGFHEKKEETRCHTCSYIRKTSEKEACNFSEFSYNQKTKKEERICIECGYLETKEHTHDFTDWYYLNKEKEEKECKICSEKETRKHTFGSTITSYEKLENNKYKEIKTTPCKTCLYENIEEQDHLHQYGEIYDYDEVNEYQKCVCHDIKITLHELEEKENFYYCIHEGCEYQKEKEHTHNFTNWYYLDKEKEERKCKICSEKETRKHTFGPTITSYEKLENNKYKEIKTTPCKTCLYENIEEQDHLHQYGEIYDYDEVNEYQKCVCHDIKITLHELEEKENFYYCIHEGCEYQKEKEHTHDFTDWYYLNNTEEKRDCSCGYFETQPHVQNEAFILYEKLENGTHEINYTCENCNHLIITEEVQACEFSSWKYNEETKNDNRTCQKCGYVEEKEHIHNPLTKKVIVGEEKVCTRKVETCRTCGLEISHLDNLNHDYDEEPKYPGTNIYECLECGYEGKKSQAKTVSSNLLQKKNLLEMKKQIHRNQSILLGQEKRRTKSLKKGESV